MQQKMDHGLCSKTVTWQNRGCLVSRRSYWTSPKIRKIFTRTSDSSWRQCQLTTSQLRSYKILSNSPPSHLKEWERTSRETMVTFLRNTSKTVWNQRFGESFSSPSHSSMPLCRRGESLDHLDGTYDTNSMIQISKLQTRCSNCFWILRMRYHGTPCFSSQDISTTEEE